MVKCNNPDSHVPTEGYPKGKNPNKVMEEWKQREQEMSGENEQERIEKVLALLMSVPARILCEKFHWKGVRGENDHRSKLLQFSEAIVKEVNRICGDENADIRKYRDETYELYGVKYEVK